MKKFYISWTLKDGRRVTDQIYTADKISALLADLDSWNCTDISFREYKEKEEGAALKTYKYYIVQTAGDGDGWTYGVFSNYGKAHQFIQNIMLPGSPVLEIFGTDESPETYTTGDTLYIYDTGKNEEVVFSDINPAVYNLAKRVYKLIKAQDWTEEADGLTDIYKSLQDFNGLYSMVEYLTAELECVEG